MSIYGGMAKWDVVYVYNGVLLSHKKKERMPFETACVKLEIFILSSKVMLKILQARLQQYMNQEISDEQAGFRKGRETRYQSASIHWIIGNAREFQKNIYFCCTDYAKATDCVDHKKLWTILKEMGIPDHLTCLLRNLCAGQEATVRTRHGTVDWFKIGKGVRQGCILLPCLFNFYALYIMQNARIDGTQAGNLIVWRNINNLRYADDTTPTAESKQPFDEGERGEWKSWLKTQHSKTKDHGIWSHHFMVNRWGKSGKQWETLFYWASKSLQMMTAAMKLKDVCCLEEKVWQT